MKYVITLDDVKLQVDVKNIGIAVVNQPGDGIQRAPPPVLAVATKRKRGRPRKISNSMEDAISNSLDDSLN